MVDSRQCRDALGRGGKTVGRRGVVRKNARM